MHIIQWRQDKSPEIIALNNMNYRLNNSLKVVEPPDLEKQTERLIMWESLTYIPWPLSDHQITEANSDTHRMFMVLWSWEDSSVSKNTCASMAPWGGIPTLMLKVKHSLYNIQRGWKRGGSLGTRPVLASVRDSSQRSIVQSERQEDLMSSQGLCMCAPCASSTHTESHTHWGLEAHLQVV